MSTDPSPDPSAAPSATAAAQAAALAEQENADLRARLDMARSSVEAAQRRADALEEALAQAQAALLAAEASNRGKDEFLAMLSHELRTPLNAMLGWAHLLQTGELDELSRIRGLSTIERNVRLQTQLVEDLLDVSRIVAGKIRLRVREVDLPAIVEAAAGDVRPAADAKDILLSIALDPSERAVAGDAARLQQVVFNLLANAVKFTQRGGAVRVTLGHSDEGTSITVADNGQGIDPDLLPHVFERFRQADGSVSRAHGGLGLGLAIVRHLVELHGGRVHAESPGHHRGATFRIVLPASARALDEQAEADATLAAASCEPGDLDDLDEDTAVTVLPTLQGVRVLLVEDDADARELLSLVLGRRGARVRAVGSVREAVEALSHTRPHVLLSDIGLPGESGFDLIHKVRALDGDARRPLPAVALTAYASDEDSRKALRAGYQMHVAKPIDPDELVALVSRLVGPHRAAP